jgi:hypothetical protein
MFEEIFPPITIEFFVFCNYRRFLGINFLFTYKHLCKNEKKLFFCIG